MLLVADDPSAAAAAAIARHARRIGLPTEQLLLTARLKHERHGLHRRDQASFWDRDLSAVLLTDSGPFRNPGSGCARASDSPETLDYFFAASVVRAAVAAVAESAQLQ